PATARARLLAATASKKDVLVDAERRKSFAETELKASEEHLTRLKEADAELADSLTLQEISRAAYRFVVNQPGIRTNIEQAGAALNLPRVDQVATETKAELLELQGLWGRAKALYLAIRNAKSRRVWFILLFCAALVLVATPLLLQYKNQLAGLPGVIITFLIGLGGLLAAVKPYLSGVGKAFKIIEDARAQNNELIERKRNERREELEQRQTQVRERLHDATQRVQEASDEVRQLEQQLDELRADRQMANFIKQRNESSDYINQLGTIARARNDFEKLSDLLAKVRKQTLAEAEAAAQAKAAPAESGPDAAATNGNPPAENLLLPRIDRIVLYIDDLDRCPEDKVVDVLQAVHLLLAFPLFVVIVGVDPRWLLHSLKQHSKVFQGAPEAGNNGTDEEERHWQSTPLNYLEKIFQIPFTLRPMAYDGFGEFIEDLASPPNDEGKKGVVDGGAATANKTEPTAGDKSEPSQPVAKPRGVTPAPPGDEKPATDTQAAVTPDVTKQSADQAAHGAEQKVAADAMAGVNTNAQKEEKPDGEADLPPEHLHIEDWERQYMKRLFWLIPSPRAAKRFVNIYRLLRASVPEEKQAAFVGETRQGQHRVALMLLAIVTGFPNEAADILRKLLQQDKSRMWWQFIDEFETQSISETKLDQEGNPQGELSEPELENLRQLFKNLGQVRELIPESQSCADFIYWAPQVARYSFQSGRVLLSRRDEDGEDD
ncbi:MAG: P-loop NTPase fold protein, partial [Pyrinomonadaceae bacterium]